MTTLFGNLLRLALTSLKDTTRYFISALIALRRFKVSSVFLNDFMYSLMGRISVSIIRKPTRVQQIQSLVNRYLFLYILTKIIKYK